MIKDLLDIVNKLPDTKSTIEGLQKINSTIDELIDYVKQVQDENKRLKNEMLDLYKRLNDKH